MLLLALFMPWAAQAQTTVEIGDGTNATNYVPIHTLYNYSITEQLYTAEEIGMSGTIQSISFNYALTDAKDFPIQVYMKLVDAADLSTGISLADADLVFDGTLSVTEKGWATITLDSPFVYDGTSNLLIGVNKDYVQWFSGSSWYYTSATNMARYSRDDNNAYTISDVPGTVTSYRPNIRMEIVAGSGPFCAKPTQVAVNYTGGTTAEVSWNSDAASFYIDVNGTVTNNVTNPYTLTGLDLATTYTVKVQAVCGGENGSSDWTSGTSFTTDFCMPENLCVINITLEDSYGDGWNGGKMEVVDALTNSLLGTFTLTSGGSETFTPEFCIGREINFVYTAGSYSYENGWTITDVNGDLIAEQEATGDYSQPLSSGIVATHTVACPSCLKPNITLGEVTHTTANLTWNDKGASYVLRYRTAESIVPAADAFFDDFENGIDNWTIYQEGEAGGNWAITQPSLWTTSSGDPISAHSGQNVAIARSWNSSALNADNWLVSPELTIPAVMSFWVMGDANYPETYSICVSTTDNAVDSFTAIATYTENPEDWTLMTIDLSAYEGETGYIAFHQYGYDADFLFIDDVTIGKTETIPAGTWTEIPTTELSYEITGLTADTKYDYQIKTICSDTDESDYTTVASFTTLSDRVKLFVTEGNWNEAANWVPEGEPTAEQDVVIRANVVIPEGVIAQATSITQESGTITIKDGAELEFTTGTVTATVEKAITGYTGTRDHYYLLSSPLGTAVSAAVENLLTNDYDYYWFNGAAEEEEWQNYEASNFNMKNGWGYLYANSQTTTLLFTGTLQTPAYYYAGGSSTSYLTYDETTSFGTFNLLGNVFARKGYLMYYDGTNAENITDFYVMGDGKLIPNTNPYLLPCQGAMIQATTTNQLALVGVQPYPTSKNANGLNMTVTANNETVDVARIRFNEGHGLQKIQFGKNDGKLYMPVEGKDYAVAYTNDNAGEMPVNFKAEKSGSYTISFNTDNIEFGYLHLIDNMTGADVDLLKSASYTFDAQPTDYASRFKLVFATGKNNDNPCAFISNGEIILNGIDGNTTVQLFDVTGRMISSTNSANRISIENMAAGVYVLRLVNGNNVKSQKIVIK